MITYQLAVANYVLYRYREGMLKAKEDMNVRTQEAVELATKEVVALTENYNPEEVDDEDIDELLTWTNGLNFEE